MINTIYTFISKFYCKHILPLLDKNLIGTGTLRAMWHNFLVCSCMERFRNVSIHIWKLIKRKSRNNERVVKDSSPTFVTWCKHKKCIVWLRFCVMRKVSNMYLMYRIDFPTGAYIYLKMYTWLFLFIEWSPIAAFIVDIINFRFYKWGPCVFGVFAYTRV